MAEQQKVTDNLTLIEVDIENAIMNNELDAARAELATLVEKSPESSAPRIPADVDRPRRRTRRSSRGPAVRRRPQACIGRAPPSGERVMPRDPTRGTHADRAPERTPERVAARAPDRSVTQRTARETPPPRRTRTYGAPISEPPRAATIALECADQLAADHARRDPARQVLPRPHRRSQRLRRVGRAAPRRFRVSPRSSNAVGLAPASASAAAAPRPRRPRLRRRRRDSGEDRQARDARSCRATCRARPRVSCIVKFDIGENGRVEQRRGGRIDSRRVFDDAAADRRAQVDLRAAQGKRRRRGLAGEGAPGIRPG